MDESASQDPIGGLIPVNPSTHPICSLWEDCPGIGSKCQGLYHSAAIVVVFISPIRPVLYLNFSTITHMKRSQPHPSTTFFVWGVPIMTATGHALIMTPAPSINNIAPKEDRDFPIDYAVAHSPDLDILFLRRTSPAIGTILMRREIYKKDADVHTTTSTMEQDASYLII
ncbi:hypothetical protein BDZ94DRAFT_1047400 [Collybia nuda]|uniref:Uncharacterized protein n=1 Tax=Collybia nuda TaxID=64659 RepID=A0A9P5XX03_9AGAR|nr:hypothetical protein BDZ94DRAFT_1047400 [Collybia nuda]